MNIKAMAAAVALGAAALAGPAAAAEPVTLSVEQMDQVSAGVLQLVLFNGTSAVWGRQFNIDTGTAEFVQIVPIVGKFSFGILIAPPPPSPT